MMITDQLTVTMANDSQRLHYITQLGKQAQQASRELAKITSGDKNKALEAIAQALREQKTIILKANCDDVARAKAQGLATALVDRLTLSSARFDAMLTNLAVVTALPDPINEISRLSRQENGLQVGQMRVPIGVIAIIYESRPNVTIDAAALCLKSGNAVILRGGSEALASNQAIFKAIETGLQLAGLPANSVQLIEQMDHALIQILVQQSSWLDLLIPRGSRRLIEAIEQYAKVPILKHLDGNCHIYVDEFADLAMATQVVLNAKTYRVGICGAMEKLLVHQNIAATWLPIIAQHFAMAGVSLKGCWQTQTILPTIAAATENDWFTEYLAPQLAIKIVADLTEAITHINHYGSHHTDAIISDSLVNSQQFLIEVDSSSVMINAPTCFADGAEYGLGAEIGISTNKLHARGPVGLIGLTTQKYVVFGSGQLRG